MSNLTFQGQIWRVFPVPGKAHVIVECRDGDQRETVFYSVSLSSSAITGSFQDTIQKWWISTAVVLSDFLVLQGFKDIQHPAPLGLWVLDPTGLQLLWKNNSLSYLGNFSETTAWVKEEATESGSYLLNLSDGQKCAEQPDFRVVEGIGKEAAVPAHFAADTEEFEEVKQILAELYSLEIVSAVDYLEYKGQVVISCYLWENESFTNILLFLDQEGELKLKEVLSKDNKGIGAGTFFVHENRLVFVRQRNILTIYEID